MVKLVIVISIILLHFLIYSIPPLFGSFIAEKSQIILNYTYLGVLFALVQFYDSMYAIVLTSEYSLNGGDIAYSALIFATLYLITTRPEPAVVRNLIFIFVVNTIFLFLLFGLLNKILESQYVINYLNISDVFLEFSLRSLFYSLLLFSGEIILILYLIKKLKQRIESKRLISFSIGIIYATVILIDGIVYPLGINLMFPESHLSVVNGIIAKFIFGFGFGLILIFLLSYRPGRILEFIRNNIPLREYILPPSKEYLAKKLERAEAEIKELKNIVPICSWCKKIRDDEGYWNQIEAYLSKDDSINLSHGVCPECFNEEF